MSSATGSHATDVRSSRRRRPLLIVFALVFLISSAVLLAARPWSNVRRPNVVLIVTDDQRWDTLAAMPAVRRLLVNGGVTFENAFTTTPSCCPSRVGLLTGEYSHHTGVLDGSAGNAPGGAPAFEDGSSIATWLHDAGYRTGLFGKYLNDYAELPRGYIPPGWDEWVAIAQGHPQIRYYDYELNENGRIVPYGDSPSDYSTTVLGEHAASFIRGDQPFFLYFAPIAPHPPSLPAPQDAGAHLDLTWNVPPSFAEHDMSDKPGGGAGALDVREARGVRQDMLRSLLAVDRAVETIAETIEDAGLSNDTYFVFTSDNGYLWGEHRLLGKVWPYEESIRVPLVIRPPGQHVSRTVDAFALNIDIAPTIADLAGVDPPLPQDGKSLVPLLDRDPGAWRDRFVVEFLGYAPGVPAYSGIRTHRYLYVEYENGRRELYDLRADPFELRNMLGESRGGSPDEVVDQLRRSMEHITER
jgi:N-acetylglucosamine-6-sulfatase